MLDLTLELVQQLCLRAQSEYEASGSSVTGRMLICLFAVTKLPCAEFQRAGMQVLEVGPVGWAPDDASQKLYIHSQQGTSYGNASRLVAAALQAAASVREVQACW